MRTFLIATVASAALFGAASAHAQAVGHVGANYTRVESDFGDGDAFQLEGAAAFQVGGLGAQVDGSVTDGEDMDTIWSATGHLNGKFGGALVGGFAGLSPSDGDTLWGIGAEAQTAIAPSTVLYGQVGYGQIDDVDVDLWAARGELRHYFTESFRLSGSIGYLNADSDFGDSDAWTFGVDAEYQFAGTPLSVYGGYQRAEFDGDVDSDTFQIGLRFTFGGATLRARDDAGAMLGSVSKLFGAVN